MKKTGGTLLALVPFLASPVPAQQATLVVENGRVITGDGTEVAQDRPKAARFDVNGPGVVVEALRKPGP